MHHRLHIILNERIKSALDELAHEAGISNSDVVRQLILAEHRKKKRKDMRNDD